MHDPMNTERPKNTLHIGFSSSGAYSAALEGHVVVIVDVIDMSTSAEAAIQAGAAAVFGSSLDISRPPVPIDPANIGRRAAIMAKDGGHKIIVICEPRSGTDELRENNVKKLLSGMEEQSIRPSVILPNIGAEVQKLTDLKDAIVIIASDSGGVAFDAAYNAGAPLVTVATIARTIGSSGWNNTKLSALRAIKAARDLDCPLTFIAASHNSPEDILAASELSKVAIENGFLDLRRSDKT